MCRRGIVAAAFAIGLLVLTSSVSAQDGLIAARAPIGQVVDPGNTLTLDFDPANISGGAPPGWGTSCVHVNVGPTNGGAFWYQILPPSPKGYTTTLDFILASTSMVDGTALTLAISKAAGDIYTAQRNWRLYLRRTGANYRFLFVVDEDAEEAAYEYPTVGSISLGTVYHLQLTYDIVHQRIAWAVNGVTANSVAMIPGNPQNAASRFIGSSQSSDARNTTYLLDNVTWTEIGTTVTTSSPVTASSAPLPPATLRVPKISWSIDANPANDPAIVTAAAYRANTAGQIAAYAKAREAGADHLQGVFKWNEVEATLGVYDFTKVDTLVANSGDLPLVLNIAPIWDDGNTVLPGGLAFGNFTDAAVVTAYQNMLTALQSHLKGRLYILNAGNEADTYLTTASRRTQYAGFLLQVRAWARTLFGVNPFKVSTCLRSSTAATWSDWADIEAVTDLNCFTYYPPVPATIDAFVAQVMSDFSQMTGTRPAMFQEVGLSSTATGSSEALQTAAVQVLSGVIALVATTPNRLISVVTWSQLEDLSAAVISSFGYSSGQFTAGIGLRDTTNIGKAAYQVLCGFLNGTQCGNTVVGTLPGTPTNLLPANGATNLSTSPTLSWTQTDATNNTVKLDTVNPPVTSYPAVQGVSSTSGGSTLAFGNSVDGGFSFGSTHTFQFDNGAGNLLLVGSWARSGAACATDPVATYNGASGTLLNPGGVVYGTDRYTYLFAWTNPATGPHPVVITCPSSDAVEGMAVSYTGAKTVSIPDSQATGISATGDTHLTLSTTVVASGSWLVGFFRNSAGQATAGAGSIVRQSSSNGAAFLDSNGIVAPGSQSLDAIFAGNTNWAGIIVSIAPNAPSGGGGPPSGSVTFTPSVPLANGTTYYWQPCGANANGSTCGSIVSFSTQAAIAGSPPSAITNVTPTNGATGTSIALALVCSATAATSYSLYFGTDNPPTNLRSNFSLGSSCTYSTAALNYSTTYYWKIVATNANGSTTGAIWSFSTGTAPTSGSCPTVGDNSPTGRNPRGFWTCASQHRFNEWYADYLANPTSPSTVGGQWVKSIRANADLDGFTPSIARYGSVGRWALMYYQMTGDPTYATKAWTQFKYELQYPADFYGLNDVREFFMDGVWLYDWLYPALSVSDRADLLTWLNRQGDLSVGAVTPHFAADLSSNPITTTQASELVASCSGTNDFSRTATPTGLLTTLRRHEDTMLFADGILSSLQTAQLATLSWDANSNGTTVTGTFRGAGSISAVNTTGAHFGFATANTAVAPALSYSSGNAALVCVRWSQGGDPNSELTSVTDDAGNVYTSVDRGGTTIGGYMFTQMFYARNVTANAANVVTAHFSTAAPVVREITVTQYSGLSTAANLLDQHDHRDWPTTPSRTWSGNRRGDTDNSMGVYFALLMMDYVTHPENSHALFLSGNGFDPDSGTAYPMGGVTASSPLPSPTSDPTVSLRNMLAYFVSHASDGQWLTSSEYDPDEVGFALRGSLGANAITGANYFPDFDALWDPMAKSVMSQFPPGFFVQEHIQWADEENPHAMKPYNWVPFFWMLSGATSGHAINPYYNQFRTDVLTATGFGQSIGDAPTILRVLWLLDPNHEPRTTGWQSFVGHTNIERANGHFMHRTGDTTTDSLFWAHVPGHLLDHYEPSASNFWLWRKGQWVVSSVLGYYEQFTYDMRNGLVPLGMGRSLETGGLTVAEAVDGEYAYVAGTNAGVQFPNFNPLSTVGTIQADIQENTRAWAYLPSAGSDVILIVDRANILRPLDDPQYLTNYNSAYRPHYEAHARVVWQLHQKTLPTVAGSTISWDVGTTHVKSQWLTPTAPTLTIVNETSEHASNGLNCIYGLQCAGINSSELGYHVDVAPAIDAQFNVFVNCLRAYEGTDPVTCAPLASSAGQAAKGALVQRTGLSDAAWLFSARQGPLVTPNVVSGSLHYAEILNQTVRAGYVFTSGTTFSYTAATATSKVYVADLSTSKTWTYTLDGGGSTALSVSSQGIGKIPVSGAGVHTLVLTGT